MEDVPMLSNLLRFDREQARWMDKGLCVDDGNQDTWYPEPPTSNKTDQARYAGEVAYAIAICDQCPVKDLCLKDASGRGETHGIWGGQDFYKSRRQQAAESRLRIAS